jgi:hypothetical protein
MSADIPTSNGSGSAAPAADTSSTPAPAAPATVAETASRVIDQYDSAEAAKADTPPAELPSPDAPGSDEALLSEEEQILREFRYNTQFKPDGREHHIPRSKVLKMLAAGLKRGTEKWTGEKTTLEGELGNLRDFRDRFAQALQGDERAFIAEIARHDPRYARFLEEKAAEATAEAVSDEPQPDIDLGNGQFTFSKGGLQKWVDWAVRQRLQPIEQQRQQEEQARQQQAQQARERQAQQALRAHVMADMAKAREWPNWAEYADDILGKLRADSAEAKKHGHRPRMTVREAYLEVKSERLSGDANDSRARVIKDLQNAPRSTSMRPGSEVPRTAQPRSIRDIAARTIDRLERQGS